MKHGKSQDVLRAVVRTKVEAAAGSTLIERDICAAVRAHLLNLGEAFDPWDGPLDVVILRVYRETAAAKTRGVRRTEVAYDEDGARVDRHPEQLTLFEAEAGLDRRIAQHDADGVSITRWQRVISAAKKAADEKQLDPRKATLRQLLGKAAVREMLADTDRAAA